MVIVENVKMCELFKQEKKIDLNEDVKWFQWVIKKEIRMVKFEEKEIIFIQKDEI